MVFKDTGKWRSTLLPEGVSHRFFLAQTSTIRLRERVSDEPIRQLAKELTNVCVEVGMADSQSKGRHWMIQAADISGVLNMRIGEQLRTLDNIEDAAIAKK